MQVDIFSEYLSKQKINKSTIEEYTKFINDFDVYLLALGTNGVDKSLLKSTEKYLKQANLSKDEIDSFCIALKYYGLAIGNANILGIANKLMGKSTWIVRLEDTLDEYIGVELRKKIMSAGGPIKDSSSRNKKAAWAKCMVDCLVANVDEVTCVKILTNNLHYKSPKSSSFQRLKRMYEKTRNIDTVLACMHDDWKTRIGERYGYDSPEFKFVANDPTIEAGKREGNIIYVSKIPFQLTEYLNAKDEKMKRFHYCHCGWVRASIPKSEVEQISPIFCHCSGGWHKVPFEGIFDQTLKVELVKSVLKGDETCLFAIHLPDDVMISEE